MSSVHKPQEGGLYGQPTLYNSGHRDVPQISPERVKHARRMFWVRLTALLGAVVVAIAAAIAIMAATINWDNKVTHKEGARSVRRAGPASLEVQNDSPVPVVIPFLTSSSPIIPSGTASINDFGTSVYSSRPPAFLSARFANKTTMAAITLPGSALTTSTPSLQTGPYAPPIINGTGFPSLLVPTGTLPHNGTFTASSDAPYGNGSNYHYPTSSGFIKTATTSLPLTTIGYTTPSNPGCTEAFTVTVTTTITASTNTTDSVSSYTTFTTSTPATSSDNFTETETTTITPTFTTFDTTTVRSLQIITVLDTVSGTVVPVTTFTIVDGQPPFATGNVTHTSAGTASTGFLTATGDKPLVTDDGSHGEFSGHNQLSASSRLGLSTFTMLVVVALAAFFATW
ncbi:hypothetical protein BROUX41_004883 [Berkeleyomyces rouxiae]|uniref:uncharacterized protein n=1 Tax=Berkeleyomyces rouxiae TaxID=2035830 RepID=UPI003B79EED3